MLKKTILNAKLQFLLSFLVALLVASPETPAAETLKTQKPWVATKKDVRSLRYLTFEEWQNLPPASQRIYLEGLKSITEIVTIGMDLEDPQMASHYLDLRSGIAMLLEMATESNVAEAARKRKGSVPAVANPDEPAKEESPSDDKGGENDADVKACQSITDEYLKEANCSAADDKKGAEKSQCGIGGFIRQRNKNKKCSPMRALCLGVDVDAFNGELDGSKSQSKTKGGESCSKEGGIWLSCPAGQTMCNPLLYGYGNEGGKMKAVCVSMKNKQVTEQCGKKAKPDDMDRFVKPFSGNAEKIADEMQSQNLMTEENRKKVDESMNKLRGKLAESYAGQIHGLSQLCDFKNLSGAASKSDCDVCARVAGRLAATQTKMMRSAQPDAVPNGQCAMMAEQFKEMKVAPKTPAKPSKSAE